MGHEGAGAAAAQGAPRPPLPVRGRSLLLRTRRSLRHEAPDRFPSHLCREARFRRVQRCFEGAEDLARLGHPARHPAAGRRGRMRHRYEAAGPLPPQLRGVAVLPAHGCRRGHPGCLAAEVGPPQGHEGSGLRAAPHAHRSGLHHSAPPRSAGRGGRGHAAPREGLRGSTASSTPPRGCPGLPEGFPRLPRPHFRPQAAKSNHPGAGAVSGLQGAEARWVVG
mmetsp:Transcript_50182/g.162449  ORF Transcript_50182/g.162449 Transcript_50182/m.162449 type:complete len:222 (+) Transcript_50182:2338-3003(+)